MAKEYWILKRYKPIISICYHAEANMRGIKEAGGLLRIPEIFYNVKEGHGDIIRNLADRDAYMRDLGHFVKEKPEEINRMLEKGIELNGEIMALMERSSEKKLKKLDNGGLKELLGEYFKIVPESWLRSTFIPYYVGEVEGFEKRINLDAIRELRLKTYADEAIPQMIEISREILSRSGIATGYPECATYDELLGCLKGRKIGPKVLFERHKHSFVAVKKGEFGVHVGKEAESMEKRIYSKVKIQKELKGTPTFNGKVAGKAFLAVKPDDLKRMEKGTILVTHMTTPDFVPYFSKVAAIVTDEGGLTSHAAIVSREFKIPCIVGTKFATKSLKTGDRIEIDANTGIVKKL